MGDSSVKKTILVAFCLCLVCSVVVSSAAILLREKQEINKKLDVKRNLLLASGMITNSSSSEEEILEAYQNVDEFVIDLESGKTIDEINPETFDQKKSAKISGENKVLSADLDLAKIKSISKYAKVYLIRNLQGDVEQIVLPVHGKGLWSTLYGFLALAPDTKTIKGLGFYEHLETPGLGGEVDNPKWKKIWKNKQALDDKYQPQIRVVKGVVTSQTPGSEYKVDALSGATITGNGVQALVNFWLGNEGFGPFLSNYRANGGL